MVLGLALGVCLVLLYADNGVVLYGLASGRPKCAHSPIPTVHTGSNFLKSKAMTCQAVTLRFGVLEDSLRLQCTGRGSTYQERLRIHVPCPDCGVELSAGSMMAHRRRMHGTDLEID